MDLYSKSCGQGEPLLILHGLFGSSDNWHSIGSRLASKFKVLALDQRNHGRSPHSFEMDYPTLAGDVRQFLGSQSIPDAFVLGHSMGGKTAMQLALLYPQLIRKLVVVDIAPRAYSPRHEKIVRGMLSLDLSRFQTRQDLEAALAPAIPDRPTRQFLLKNAVRTDSSGFRWRLGLRELQQNYLQLTQAVRGERMFDKPALFIRGEKSDYLLADDLPSIRRLFPQAQLQTVAGAGHLLHVEKPDAFVRLILDFCAPPNGGKL